ncbi:MAG: class I SAM-dependent methyltransferase [Nanoarchaeota archaeon]|nr:class I SAM-dependent methyltransferase [Nanoarchaeota archaeon]
MKDYNYTTFAEFYDDLELDKNKVKELNEVLDRAFKKFKVKTVLDLTCGTGAQVEYLSKKRYVITGSDLNKDMLDIAKKKCPDIDFHQGDMRTAKYGKFDVVITIFNSIGHLSKKDFEKAMKNISGNLNEHGVYIFDIFNLDFMKKNFINHEFMDFVKEVKDMKAVRFNNNKLDLKKGVMHINQKTFIQKGKDKLRIIKEKWDMQVYSSDELKEMLKRNGFEVLEFLDITGKGFDKDKSISILTIARKVE